MESQRIVLDWNEVAWIVEERRARFPEGECGFACLGRGSRGGEGRSKNGGTGLSEDAWEPQGWDKRPGCMDLRNLFSTIFEPCGLKF